MSDELINAMTNEDLQAMKEKNGGNVSVATLIDGILEARGKAEVETKAKLEFEKGITKVFAKLPHPEDVHNVYVRWGEVDVEDGEPVSMAFKDGIVFKPASELTEEELSLELTYEERTPSHKEYQWVVQVNKSVNIGSSASGKASTANKREVVIYKHNAGGADEEMGTFKDYTEFIKSMGFPKGGDSANRVAERNGYYGKPTS